MGEFLEGHIDNWAPFEDEIRENISQHPRYALIPIEADLRKAMSACSSCKKRLPARDSASSNARTHIPHKPVTKPMIPPNSRHALLHGTVSKTDWVENLDEALDVSLQNADLNAQEPEDHSSDSESSRGDPWKEKPTCAFQVRDWKQARIGRFPRPKQGPVLPPFRSLRGL